MLPKHVPTVRPSVPTAAAGCEEGEWCHRNATRGRRVVPRIVKKESVRDGQEVSTAGRLAAPPRCNVGRQGRELFAVLRERDESRAVLVRLRGREGTRARRVAGVHG